MPAPFQQLADRTLLTRRIQHMALHWRKLYPYLTLQPKLVPPNMSKTGGKTVLDIPWTMQQRAHERPRPPSNDLRLGHRLQTPPSLCWVLWYLLGKDHLCS